VAVTGASGGSVLKFGNGLLPATSFVPSGYVLAWNDEFNGTTIDTTKWTVRNNSSQSYSADYDTSRPQNVFLQNGILTQRALRESLGGFSFTSASMDTIGHQNFGVNTYYEIRTQTPTQPNTSAGIWPAFWLRSNETGAEDDIAEWYGNPQPADPRTTFNKSTITVHEDTSGTGSRVGYDAFMPTGQAPWSAFHTYGCLVASDGYRFYVDGVLVKTMLLSTYPWMSAGLASTWNIRMNLQIGKTGSWAGAPDANTLFPADYKIDYVRIYRPGP
jgi:beta-glucanase (GH16 family)